MERDENIHYKYESKYSQIADGNTEDPLRV